MSDRKKAYILDMLCAGASVVAVVLALRTTLDYSITIPAVGFVSSIIAATFFYRVVNSGWVRHGAEAYADELLKHARILASAAAG